MFELFGVIGTMLIAATVLKHYRDQRDKSKPNKPAVKTSEQENAPTTPLGDKQLGQLHAVPRDSRFSFVSAFGVNPQTLKELHVYASAGNIEDFPGKVIELLRRLYDNGYAVGEEIMALLHHGRSLKEGEAIYVAVVRDNRTNAQRTIAFLDRYRAC